MLKRVLQTYRAAFGGLSREVWILTVITFVHRSGTMVLPFLALYLTTQQGATAQQAGIVMTLWGLGAVIGSWLAGRMSDWLGTTRAQVSLLVLGAIGFWLLGHAQGWWAIAVTVLYTAATAEGFRAPNSAALAEYSEPDVRARAYALRRLAVNMGMTTGPAVGGFLALIDYRWLFWIDGATCMVAAVLLHITMRSAVPRTFATDETTTSSFAPQDSAIPSSSAVDTQSPWRDRIFVALLVLTAVNMTIFLQLFSAWPLVLHDIFHMSEAQIGTVVAFNTLTIIAFEMVLVHRVERYHPLRIAAWGAIFVGLGLGVLPYGVGIIWVIFTVLLWTCGEMLNHPMVEAFVAARMPLAASGRYMALYTMAISLAFMLAPVTSTTVYQLYGHETLALGSLALALLVALGYLHLARLTPGARLSKA
ncbi:MAG: MFS transporter [Acidobacteriota bacterium]